MAKKNENATTKLVIGSKIDQLCKSLKRVERKIQKLIDFWMKDFPVKCSFQLNLGGESFCTNNSPTVRPIVVGLQKEWCEKLSNWILEYIVIPFLAEHEADHAKWTDDNFGTAIKLAAKRINEMAEAEGLVVHQQALMSICHRTANILEDGRIELKDSRENIGFNRNRLYFRSKLWEWAYVDCIRYGLYKKVDEGMKISMIQNNLLTLATLYELPKEGERAKAGVYNKGWLNVFRDSDMHETIKECKPWVLEGINGEVCADIVVPTVKIVEKLWKYMRDTICIGQEDFDAIERFIEELRIMIEEDEVNHGKANPKKSIPTGSDKPESEEDSKGDEESGEEADSNSEDAEISENTGSGDECASEEAEKSEDADSGTSEEDKNEDTTSEKGDSSDNEGSPKTDLKAGGQSDEAKADNSSSSSSKGDSGEPSEEDNFDFDKEPEDTSDGDEESEDADTMQSQRNTQYQDTSEAQADKERLMERDPKSLEDALAGCYDEDECIKNFREDVALRTNPCKMSMEARIQGNKLKRFFENYLRNKSTPNRVNLVSGKVNTKQLTKVCIGQQDYFKRMGQPWKPDCSFYILLDDSGSMNGKKRMYAARQCSALEFGIPNAVPFKIAAFDTNYVHGQYYVRHRMIKDWNEKCGNFSYSETWLQNNDCGGGNKDGYSIRVATHELLQRPEQRKMLIVLSDGEPTDYNGGQSQGYADVRNAVEEARKSGIDVVAIFFGDANFIKNSTKHYEYMYQKDYIGVMPDSIFPELEKVLKRLLK